MGIIVFCQPTKLWHNFKLIYMLWPLQHTESILAARVPAREISIDCPGWCETSRNQHINRLHHRPFEWIFFTMKHTLNIPWNTRDSNLKNIINIFKNGDLYILGFYLHRREQKPIILVQIIFRAKTFPWVFHSVLSLPHDSPIKTDQNSWVLEQIAIFHFSKSCSIIYPLVNIQKTVDNHRFQWVNQLILWPAIQ